MPLSTISVEEKDIAEAEGTAAGEYAAENYDGEAIEVAITDYPSIESLVERADLIESSFLAAFPTASALAELMRQADLADVYCRTVGGGTVALHIGTKVVSAH